MTLTQDIITTDGKEVPVATFIQYGVTSPGFTHPPELNYRTFCFRQGRTTILERWETHKVSSTVTPAYALKNFQAMSQAMQAEPGVLTN